MAKKFYVTVDGLDVEVTEEVYRAYKQPLWSEHKRIERSQKCNLGKKRCDKNAMSALSLRKVLHCR